MLQINLIKSMRWGDAAKTSVILVADTNEGNDLTIATPYSTESIIWDSVRAYDVSLITDYVAPPPPPAQPPQPPTPE